MTVFEAHFWLDKLFYMYFRRPNVCLTALTFESIFAGENVRTKVILNLLIEMSFGEWMQRLIFLNQSIN
jgi:hypothetical protein